MELLLLICAYLLASTVLGIAAGWVITRRDAGEPARPEVRERAPRLRSESSQRP